MERSEPTEGQVSMLLWSRFIWRHWCREWRLTAMLTLIVALGVAVFLSIRLANKAAVSGFGLFTESIAGESDFLLRPRSGELSDSLLSELRSLAGGHPLDIFPVIERSGVMGGPEGDAVRILGIDFVAMQNAASYSAGGESHSAQDEGGLGQVNLGRSDIAISGEAFSKRFDLSPGESFRLFANDQEVDLTIAAALPENPNFPAIPGNLLLMDLPGLQTLLGIDGKLSRVEFRVPPGARQRQIREEIGIRLAEFSKIKGLVFETPQERKSSVTQMSAAFRLNLSILSGLALMVGMYLIMQAMEAAVVKRRSEMAVMRSLGVTPRQIRRAWVIEGLILGLIGSLLGVVIGVLLAFGLVGGISRTVNTLYYETTTSAVRLEGWELGFSMIFGMLASLVAVLVPAREAAMTQPAQLMRQGGQKGGLALLRKNSLGMMLLVVSIGAAFIPGIVLPSGAAFPIGGYLASVFIVLGGSILIGILFRPFGVALASKILPQGAMFRYAVSQLRQPAGRHRLTAAGLAVAIGMSAAMGILVASFENTLTSWIQQLLKADIYVSPVGIESVSNESTMSRYTWESLASIPGVAGVDNLRRYRVSIQGQDAFLGGADYHEDEKHGFQMIWLNPPEDSAVTSLASSKDGIYSGWASEAFSRRFDSGVGKVVDLPTPGGIRKIRVEGIYADYGNETGMLIVGRKFTRQWFEDDQLSQMALYLNEGVDELAVLEEIRTKFPLLRARTNARLREESIRIFHQTFTVTYALEAIAVFIAVSGLGLALAGLLLERKNELGTLKSLGATRREIASATAWEGTGIACVGLVGGYLMSFLLGWVLIFVINPQSFGWTLSYKVPWLSFVALAVLTLGIAAAVSWFVGYRNAVLRSDQED